MSPLELTQKLLQFPSITPDGTKCLDFITDILSCAGFVCYRLPFNEVDNLYARFGLGQPNVCFLGHVDVVPIQNGWSVDPFAGVIKNNQLIGRGVVDMKGAIACFIAAALKKINHDHFNGSISILLTADEEGLAINGTKKVVEWLKDRQEAIDLCLIGEPTSEVNLGDTIKVGRRGSLNAELILTGKSGHIAYPDKITNLLAPVLIDLANTLQNITLDNGYDNFQPSKLMITQLTLNSPAGNIIPSEGKIGINIRFNPSHNFKSLTNLLDEVLQKKLTDQKGINGKWSFNLSAEPFYNYDIKAVEILQKVVHKNTGFKPDISTQGGTSDGRFIHHICPVIECGLKNETAHQTDEHCDIKDLENLYQIYFDFLSTYFLESNYSVK